MQKSYTIKEACLRWAELVICICDFYEFDFCFGLLWPSPASHTDKALDVAQQDESMRNPSPILGPWKYWEKSDRHNMLQEPKLLPLDCHKSHSEKLDRHRSKCWRSPTLGPINYQNSHSHSRMKNTWICTHTWSIMLNINYFLAIALKISLSLLWKFR